MNERQQETTNTWYMRSKKKRKIRTSEYRSTKIWERKSQYLPSFKNMNSITNCKLISKIDKRGTIFHLCYAFAIKDHAFMRAK